MVRSPWLATSHFPGWRARRSLFLGVAKILGGRAEFGGAQRGSKRRLLTAVLAVPYQRIFRISEAGGLPSPSAHGATFGAPFLHGAYTPKDAALKILASY
jgi:hypothetical protein